MKYLSLLALAACSFASCAGPSGFQRTAMDQTRHFESQPMDAYYASESDRLVREDRGHECSRIGAGNTFPESFEHWRKRGTGVHYFGRGWQSGTHAVEWGCYLDHGRIVNFGCGPITTQAWKGGERKPIVYW